MSTYAVKTPEKAEAGGKDDAGGSGGFGGGVSPERRASVSSSLDAMLDTEYLQKNLAQTKTLKEQMWALMDDAGSSLAANTISILIMALIAVSCVAFVVETIPEIYASEQAKMTLSTIEAVCSILFTIEYVLRFFSAPDKIEFLKGLLNFVDLIAVAPWYIEKMLPMGEGGGTAFVRIIRLVRVFRVLKVSRYLTWVRLFASALGKSSQPLAMLLFIIVIAMIFFSRYVTPVLCPQLSPLPLICTNVHTFAHAQLIFLRPS
jgi:flagellar biosynthesis protein FlhB